MSLFKIAQHEDDNMEGLTKQLCQKIFTEYKTYMGNIVHKIDLKMIQIFAKPIALIIFKNAIISVIEQLPELNPVPAELAVDIQKTLKEVQITETESYLSAVVGVTNSQFQHRNDAPDETIHKAIARSIDICNRTFQQIVEQKLFNDFTKLLAILKDQKGDFAAADELDGKLTTEYNKLKSTDFTYSKN